VSANSANVPKKARNQADSPASRFVKLVAYRITVVDKPSEKLKVHPLF